MTHAIIHASSRLRRNEGHAHWICHAASHHRHLSSTNHQRCHLLGSGLLVNLQHHHRATNTQRMKGNHIHISLITEVPYGLWDRRGPWGLDGNPGVLYSHV